MVKDYLNQINGRLTDDVNLFTGGLNTYSDKAFIEPYEMPYVMNMTVYKPPMMCTRASRDNVFMIEEEKTVIVSMWANDEDLIAYVTRNNLTGEQKLWIRYYDIKNAKWKIIQKDEITLPYYVDLYFCYCRTGTSEYLYLGNQSYKYKIELVNNTWLEDTENEVTVLYPAEEIDDGYWGVPCWHKGRMFFAGSEKIYFSALNDFDNFTEFPDMTMPKTLYSDVELTDGTEPAPPDVPSVSGAYNTGEYEIKLNGNVYAPKDTTFYYDTEEKSITFETGYKLVYKEISTNTYKWQKEMPDYSSYAGEFLVTTGKGNIVMIKSFDDKLVIFCEHSIHLLYGDTPLTTSGYQFQLVDFNNNLGCISPRTVAVASNRLFWLGDDREIYSYSGSYIEIISQPYADKRTSGLDSTQILEHRWAIAVATSNKYYIQLRMQNHDYILFVYDMLKGIWWTEDTGDSGRLYSITNFSNDVNSVIMSNGYGEVLKTTKRYDGIDYGYSPTQKAIVSRPIHYKFHTRVYGADGANSRKTLTKVYIQASANANVYISDSWTSSDEWAGKSNDNSLKKIGELSIKGTKRMTNDYLDTYDSNDYEQQLCVVPKMYGERLNTFQIVVEGDGASKFYLMKREWSAR